jgi:hypothetical protein
MIARILSFLFPPKLPRPIQDWGGPAEPFDEQGWAGNVQRRYRNGIERHFAQIRAAENIMANMIQKAEAEGYVRTIHDCYEKREKWLTYR